MKRRAKQSRSQGYARIRTTALISGNRDVVQLRPPVSTAQMTVISPELADQIGSHGRPGPVRCTRSAMGEYCGPTRPIAIVVGERGADRCRGVDVRAIVAQIDPEIGDLIVGHDVLERAEPLLAFGHGPMKLTCDPKRKERLLRPATSRRRSR